MIEFHAEEMSENDLIEAANRIFSAQEKDFEKIKSEKWYQTLFHAITLNQDGKKFTVKSVHSLAKLQQLFMSIYVKNYRKSHEQLDEVIEVVIKNSEAIQKLYGMCVLNLEEQASLETLDAQDSEILALFLGEYRDENGSVPSAVRDYNRGVLSALNQKVPMGTLDNHQIRKLKAPKVVYRCFMEQCAIDGTIDSQEWSDKIYEDLKDFELSENSKKEIRESVKYEAEIAGVDYFIQKYSRENIGVHAIDFEIEGVIDPAEAERKEINRQFDLVRLNLALLKFSTGFTMANLGSNSDMTFVTVDTLFKEEIEADISNGVIQLPVLINSIKKSYEENAELVYAFKFNAMDDNFNAHTHYFFITTVDGFFFFVKERIAFVEYDSIRSVTQTSNSVSIFAWNVQWYSENGNKISEDNEIVIEKDNENKRYLRTLRKGVEGIIEVYGGYIEPSDAKIEEIVDRYIRLIPRSSSAVPYMVRNFGYGDDKNRKRLKNALSKYALKVREDEALGFIDTSLLGNGGDGLLFSKYGIAFDYAFEKIFARYEEIDSMTIQKGKELILSGRFSERKNDFNDPSINNVYFNLPILKECLEEIRNVI